MLFGGLIARWRSSRRRRGALRAARRELDRLFFETPELLPAARLSPKHRGRVNILESDLDEHGSVTRILFGIVRHPKAHPLAPRGDEVLELIEYLPAENRLGNVGARNLTRRPPGRDGVGEGG
jgi:hypothetical protein